MKRKVMFLITLLVILLAGCSLENAPTKGEIILQIGTASRSLTSGEVLKNMDTAYYKVTIGNHSAKIVSEGSYFRQQIETGYYSVNVEAYNCDDILLGSGSTEVYVTPGEVTKCSVEVKEISGNGTLIVHMDRTASAIEQYSLSAKIYKISADGNDVEIAEIPNDSFNSIMNDVTIELPDGYYYIYFIPAFNSSEIPKTVENHIQTFRIVNDSNSYIYCRNDSSGMTYIPYMSFEVLTDTPVMNGPFKIRYSKVGKHKIDSLSFDSEGSFPFSHSQKINIDDTHIYTDHLNVSSGEQILLLHAQYSDSSNQIKTCEYIIGEYNIKDGDRFYITPEKKEFVVGSTAEFQLNCYPSTYSFSTEWYYNGTNLHELNGFGIWYNGCSFRPDVIGENIIEAVITMEDGNQTTVSYTFEVCENATLLDDIGAGIGTPLDDGRLEILIYGNYSGSLIAYPCDENGKKTGEGAKVTQKNDWENSAALAYPKDYQADNLYVYLEGYINDKLDDSKIIKLYDYLHCLRVALSEPMFGVYTNHDKPKLLLAGLEHYQKYDVRIGYRLGAGEMHYVDGYDGPIEVIMPEDAIQSTYDLHWEIELYKNGWSNGKSSGIRHFDYYPEGLPTIPSEKVYQAVVSKADLSGNLTFEYRILTLDTDSYYFFRAVATDNKNVYVKQYLESGRGKLDSNGSTFTMNVKTTNGNRRAVECEMLENGNVRIDGIEYTSLNSIGIKQPGKSYEGAWNVPKISLGTEILYSIFEKYVNSRPEVKQIFPGIDQLLSVRFAEGASADIGAYIKDGTIKFGISADIDFSLFDKALSLADKFSPYAELSLSFSEKSNDVLTINGEDYPARIMVSSDGTVLIIYVYRDGIIIPIAMSRASEYSNPSVSAENINTFNTDRYITLTEIAEFADKMNNENPDIYQSLIDSATTAITIGDDQVEFAGCWNVISDDISSLDGARIGVAAGRMLIKPSDTNVLINGEFSDADGIVTFDNGATMKINERRVSYGTLILRVDYSVNGITQSGELWLEKYSGNAFDLLVKYNELTGYSMNKIVFTTSGNIIADIIRDGSEETVAVGTYSLGDGDITIQVNPEKIHLPEKLKGCELKAGVTLAYRDNEIILLEKFKDEMSDGEFGIQLIDTL